MSTIRAFGSFVPFTLPLGNHGHVNVFDVLLSLQFNLRIGTMYVEQKMYYVDGDILETILLQKTMNEDGHCWILGPKSFGGKCISNSQIQSSIIVLTNNSCTSIVQIPILFNVEIELNEDIVLLLSYSNDNVCHVVDLFDTSVFSLKIFKHPLRQVCFLWMLITPIAVCHGWNCLLMDLLLPVCLFILLYSITV